MAWRTAASFLKALLTPSFSRAGRVGDGREKALLEYVLANAEKGNPDSVLQRIDEFAGRSSWLMNIGKDKGAFLEQALADRKPHLALEIGTYCGYSAVKIASNILRIRQGTNSSGDSATASAAVPLSADGVPQPPRCLPVLLTVEMNPENCETARQVIEHAGLTSAVRILEGRFEQRLEEVRAFLEEFGEGKNLFDFVLLDHWKGRYLADFLLLKENGFIGEGTCVFADNMGPLLGPKDFKEYLKTHSDELETKEHSSHVEYLSWIPDSVTLSVVKKRS
eukprot:TRINITY_DN29043_c0_g1_i1.p1 TRINITY_DN29043_c0_g1~~TRINITY_DN29043_c0_g1_i1.p1  ORF type:complete len:279 (-),score=24.07 TRINITY_DN29043_c0_g1_i1:153-989(-)